LPLGVGAGRPAWERSQGGVLVWFLVVTPPSLSLPGGQGAPTLFKHLLAPTTLTHSLAHPASTPPPRLLTQRFIRHVGRRGRRRGGMTGCRLTARCARARAARWISAPPSPPRRPPLVASTRACPSSHRRPQQRGRRGRRRGRMQRWRCCKSPWLRFRNHVSTSASS